MIATGMILSVLSLGLGCIQLFDISSSVLVTQEDMVVNVPDSQFCHRLNTDYSTKEVPEYSVEACVTADIVDGIALLPNWEGEYRGEVTSIELWLVEGETETPATLLDTDEDVWCDNVDIDTDMNGNTTSTPYCASNFEFYLLWNLELTAAE